MQDKIMTDYKLTICIATFNRGAFISETLDSILPQLQSNIELIVVDGASPDNTSEVMGKYVSQYPKIRYYREFVNSGIDRDYDKAVAYAKGEYCWLLTDDDLVKPNAINKILAKLDGLNDLVVINAEVANRDFSKILDEKLIKLDSNQTYKAYEGDKFMREVGHGLSFIGCVVIKRALWLSRERVNFYGSLFIHVGVIFQQPRLKNITLIADPLVKIRYGNAMWTPRGLEIWLIKWPNLIWSFEGYSTESKSAVCSNSFLKKLKRLVFYRASGAYTYKEFKLFLEPQINLLGSFFYLVIALFPARLMNVIASIYCALINRSMKMAMYSLNNSKYQNFISRWAASLVGV